MGLRVNVYRAADGRDCTNGGISAKATCLCVVNIDGPFKPDYSTPAAILTTNQFGDPILKPARKGFEEEWEVEPVWFMFGGNYAASSDSRFSCALSSIMGIPFYGAIPIHDRHE